MNLTYVLITLGVLILILLLFRDVFAWWNKTSVMIKELKDINHRLGNMVDNQVATSKQLEQIRSEMKPPQYQPVQPIVTNGDPKPVYSYPPQFPPASRA